MVGTVLMVIIPASHGCREYSRIYPNLKEELSTVDVQLETMLIEDVPRAFRPQIRGVPFFMYFTPKQWTKFTTDGNITSLEVPVFNPYRESRYLSSKFDISPEALKTWVRSITNT